MVVTPRYEDYEAQLVSIADFKPRSPGHTLHHHHDAGRARFLDAPLALAAAFLRSRAASRSARCRRMRSQLSSAVSSGRINERTTGPISLRSSASACAAMNILVGCG